MAEKRNCIPEVIRCSVVVTGMHRIRYEAHRHSTNQDVSRDSDTCGELSNG